MSNSVEVHRSQHPLNGLNDNRNAQLPIIVVVGEQQCCALSRDPKLWTNPTFVTAKIWGVWTPWYNLRLEVPRSVRTSRSPVLRDHISLNTFLLFLFLLKGLVYCDKGKNRPIFRFFFLTKYDSYIKLNETVIFIICSSICKKIFEIFKIAVVALLQAQVRFF